MIETGKHNKLRFTKKLTQSLRVEEVSRRDFMDHILVRKASEENLINIFVVHEKCEAKRGWWKFALYSTAFDLIL